jgi:hypothetical protein
MTGDRHGLRRPARARVRLGARPGPRSPARASNDDGHTRSWRPVPVIRAYDPAFAYELATIVRDGVTRMYHDQDVYYYVTVYKELPQPAKPTTSTTDHRALTGSRRPRTCRRQGRACGLRLDPPAGAGGPHLLESTGSPRVYSATSFQQLRHEVPQVERWNRLHPTRAAGAVLPSSAMTMPRHRRHGLAQDPAGPHRARAPQPYSCSAPTGMAQRHPGRPRSLRDRPAQHRGGRARRPGRCGGYDPRRPRRDPGAGLDPDALTR